MRASPALKTPSREVANTGRGDVAPGVQLQPQPGDHAIVFGVGEADGHQAQVGLLDELRALDGLQVARGLALTLRPWTV